MNYRRQNKKFQFEEDTFNKSAQGLSKINHDVLLLMNFLQTNPQVRKMNINYYDLSYTVIKNRVEKEIINNNFEDNENGFINFIDFIIPNLYIGRKNKNKTLR